MKEHKDWIEKRQTLRGLADSALASLSPLDSTALPADVMLHELLVHKVELEMQIEELQHTHVALEEARDHYAEYYEYAPVGYLSVAADGTITEVNLTAAALLGMDRAALIQRRFARCVAQEDRERWDRLFVDMTAQAHVEHQAIALQVVRKDSTTFRAYLDCRRPHLPANRETLRITLFDIGKLQQT